MNPDLGDLTLTTKDGILNIRVVILIETPEGYIFESHEDGYVFAIGGRVKFNETSLDAAKRELCEEINCKDVKLDFRGLVENFFKVNNRKYHEINFIYYSKFKQVLDLKNFHSDHNGFVYIKKDDMRNFDIRPHILTDLIRSNNNFQHLINKDS